jgi:type IV fimbrial biogenesis protein FimT
VRVGKGFTLFELLVTLAVGAALLAAAVPTFSAWILDARLTANVNAFVLAVQVARSEAAKRNRSVIVCATPDRHTCGAGDAAFSEGWMVFVNTDERYPPGRSDAEPLLYAHVPEALGAIRNNRPFFEFRRGKRSTNGSLIFCDSRRDDAARAVIVSYTGRPRVARKDADGRPLRCPEP